MHPSSDLHEESIEKLQILRGASDNEKLVSRDDLVFALGCAPDVVADEYSSTGNARILESDQ